jgi:hypothetical protein
MKKPKGPINPMEDPNDDRPMYVTPRPLTALAALAALSPILAPSPTLAVALAVALIHFTSSSPIPIPNPHPKPSPGTSSGRRGRT